MICLALLAAVLAAPASQPASRTASQPAELWRSLSPDKRALFDEVMACFEKARVRNIVELKTGLKDLVSESTAGTNQEWKRQHAARIAEVRKAIRRLESRQVMLPPDLGPETIGLLPFPAGERKLEIIEVLDRNRAVGHFIRGKDYSAGRFVLRRPTTGLREGDVIDFDDKLVQLSEEKSLLNTDGKPILAIITLPADIIDAINDWEQRGYPVVPVVASHR